MPLCILNKTGKPFDGEARTKDFEAFLRKVGGAQTLCTPTTIARAHLRIVDVTHKKTYTDRITCGPLCVFVLCAFLGFQMQQRFRPKKSSTQCSITHNTCVCARLTAPTYFRSAKKMIVGWFAAFVLLFFE